MHDPMPSTASLEVTAHLTMPMDDPIAVRAVLRYDQADPWAVSATFHPQDDPPVTWVFARELLSVGIVGAAGLGAVRVWCTHHEASDDLNIALITGEGAALVQLSRAEVGYFLDRTYLLCELGDEHQHVDTDQAIEHLLAS